LRGWHQHIPCVRTVAMFEPRQYVTSTYQVETVWSSNSNRGLFSTWSIFWQQLWQHRWPFTPFTSPHPHVFPWEYVLVYFSLLGRGACVQCVWCIQCVCIVLLVVVCLCVPATSWSRSTHFATACAIMLRLYSCCPWFVGGKPNSIAAGCQRHATEPFLCTICVENPFCDVHVRARKDEGEGVLWVGILGSSSQVVRAMCEKLFSEKLFSKPGCLREFVWEKPFSKRPFYESQARTCSCRSCSTKVVLLEVALREAVLRTALTLQVRILAARAPHPEGATPTLSTCIENQDHADKVPDWGPMIIINK